MTFAPAKITTKTQEKYLSSEAVWLSLDVCHQNENCSVQINPLCRRIIFFPVTQQKQITVKLIHW